MESGTVAIFHDILKNLTFQRLPKALVWSKGLKHFSRRQMQMTFVVIGALRNKTDG